MNIDTLWWQAKTDVAYELTDERWISPPSSFSVRPTSHVLTSSFSSLHLVGYLIMFNFLVWVNSALCFSRHLLNYSFTVSCAMNIPLVLLNKFKWANMAKYEIMSPYLRMTDFFILLPWVPSSSSSVSSLGSQLCCCCCCWRCWLSSSGTLS